MSAELIFVRMIAVGVGTNIDTPSETVILLSLSLFHDIFIMELLE